MLALRLSRPLATPALWQVAGYATGAAGKSVELKSNSEYQEAIKNLAATKSAAVFDFGAAWCGPCKAIAPYFDSLAEEFSGKGLRFYRVDIDNDAVSEAVTENQVAAVPTFVGYQGADRVTAFSGADKAMLRRMALELSGGHLKAPQQ